MTQTKRRTVVLTAALFGALCVLVGGVRAVDEPQAKSETKKQPTATDVVRDSEEKPAASRSGGTPPEVKDAKPPTAEDQFEFRFQIVNTKGEPVAGAKVTPWGVVHSWFSSMLESKWCPETVTDAEGLARVVIAKESFKAQAIFFGKVGLPTIQSIAMTIDHPRHPVWSQYVSVGDPARVVLVDAATVEVLPRRKNDDELVRDVIPILSHYSASRADWLAMKEQSQKDGVLTIRRVDLTSENAMRWLRLVHVPTVGPAWFSELIDLKSLEAPISLKPKLRPGVRVAGRLPDMVPRPVTNGRVVAQIVSGGSDAFNNWNWRIETAISEDGTFVLESVPAHENLQLIALCDGWVSRSPTLEEATAYAKEHDFATKYHGGSMGIVYPQLFRTLVPGIEPVVPMEPTADCEVTVVDENGQPIADAEVSFWPGQSWFHSGSNTLGSGSDSLKAMQTQFQTGEAPKPPPKNKRFTAKTNARGMATIKNLPANVPPPHPTGHDFYVLHDKFEAAKRPDENGGRFKTAQTVELFPRQTGRVTVRMTAIKKEEEKDAAQSNVDNKKGDLKESSAEPVEEPEAAIAALKKLGGDVSSERVTFSNSEITDAELIHLKGMASINLLALNGCKQVTDAGLVHLKGLKNLETLHLTYTSVGDAGIEHLKGMTKLTNLYLVGTKVGDTGLEQLKGMTNLCVLYLDSPRMTDSGLEHIKGLTNLVTLSLNGSKVTNAGLKHLTGMNHLYELRLNGTEVDDAGLEHLKGLAELRDLHLSGGKVTDAGLEHLKTLTKLGRLDLSRTKVTDAGVNQLQQSLPNCRIIHSPQT